MNSPLVILSYATVCLHPSVSLNNEKYCREFSEHKIAVREKTAGLRSGNSSDLNSACLKALVPVEIFQFSSVMHYETEWYRDSTDGLIIPRLELKKSNSPSSLARSYFRVYAFRKTTLVELAIFACVEAYVDCVAPLTVGLFIFCLYRQWGPGLNDTNRKIQKLCVGKLGGIVCKHSPIVENSL